MALRDHGSPTGTDAPPINQALQVATRVPSLCSRSLGGVSKPIDIDAAGHHAGANH